MQAYLQSQGDNMRGHSETSIKVLNSRAYLEVAEKEKRERPAGGYRPANMTVLSENLLDLPQ